MIIFGLSFVGRFVLFWIVLIGVLCSVEHVEVYGLY